MAYSLATINVMKVAGLWFGAAALAAVAFVNKDGIGATIAGQAPEHSRAVEQTRVNTVATSGGTRRSSDRVVELRANRSGHFETRVLINGRAIDAMVDTGATVVALSWDDARAAGLHVTPADFTGIVGTANGTARVAPVTLDSVSIDDIVIRNVKAVVSERGAMSTSLLGMSFLGRLEKAEMSRGVMILQE